MFHSHLCFRVGNVLAVVDHILLSGVLCGRPRVMNIDVFLHPYLRLSRYA